MKIYLVENNDCNIKIDGEFYQAGSQFELNEESYIQVKDIVQVLTIFDEKDVANMKATKEKKTAKKVD